MFKVLIVEDDPMVAEINKKYTESLEEFLVASICNDGKEALKIIKKEDINLIILDVYMPKLDGISFLKEIRSHQIMTDVIMVTAADDTDKLNEVLKLGAVDYLIKPFEYERFKEALGKFKTRYKLLNSKTVINQEDVDKITKQNNFSLSDVKKGINEYTLRRIKKFLNNYEKQYFDCEDIAKKMRLSRVTIRRYLEYLSYIGELGKDVEYGDIGRPKTKYKVL